MRDMIACEILLDSEGIDLFGDPTADPQTCQLLGKVRLFLAKPRRIARIQIRFTGATHTTVQEDLDDQFPTVQLVDIQSEIMSTATRYSAGLNDIPFSILIPNDIPASCNLPKGEIYYKLTIAITADSPLKSLTKPIMVERPVHVRRSFVPGLDLLAYMPSSRCRGTRRNIMMAEFEAPKVVCLETGRIAIHGKVLGCFHKIVMRLEQLAVYSADLGEIPLRLCSNDPRRPTSMGPLFDKPVVENTISFEKTYHFDNIAGDMEESIGKFRSSYVGSPLSIFGSANCSPFDLVAEIPMITPKEPLFTDIRSPLLEVGHRLRINIHWDDKKEQTMSLAYPVVVSTLPFKDVSARSLADLAPPSLSWTRSLATATQDDQTMEDVHHDLPSYSRLIPTSTTPYSSTTTPAVSANPSPQPTLPNPTSLSSPSIPYATTAPIEENIGRAIRSVRSIMTQDTHGVGIALAKMFP